MKNINDYIRQHKKGAAIGGGIAAAVLIGAAVTAGVVSGNANKQPEAPTTLQAEVTAPSEASGAAGSASISAELKPGAPKPSETPTENSVSGQSKPASSQDSNGKANSNDKNTGKNPSNSNSSSSDNSNGNQKPENANNTSDKPTHEHSYKAVSTVSATCTNGGYTVYECNCGASYEGDQTAALGHNYEATVVEATTEAGGYTVHTCTRCGDSYKDSYTDKIVQTSWVTEEAVARLCAEADAYAASIGLIVDPEMANSWAAPQYTVWGYSYDELLARLKSAANSQKHLDWTYLSYSYEPDTEDSGHYVIYCKWG